MNDPWHDSTGEPRMHGDAAPDSGIDLGGGNEAVAWHDDAVAPRFDRALRQDMPSSPAQSNPAVIAFPVLGRLRTPLSGFLLILAGIAAIAVAILFVQPDDDVECGDYLAPEVMEPGDYCVPAMYGWIDHPERYGASYEEQRANHRDVEQFGMVVTWILIVVGSLTVLFGAAVLIMASRHRGLAAADPHAARDT